MNAVHFDHVSKTFGTQAILDDYACGVMITDSST